MVDVLMLWSQLEPSLVRKIGSSPRVRRKRNLISAAETDQPSAARWHEEQDRPLVPSDWKKGPVRSIDVLLTLYVSRNPLLLGSGKRLGKDCAPMMVPLRAPTTSRVMRLSFVLTLLLLAMPGSSFSI